jgi:ribose transport system ATP-binding protein
MAKLRLTGIHKSFDGTHALRDVSFAADGGEVLALCGENGAGKSTLIKILSGAVQPDRGEIFLNEKNVRIETPHSAIGLGIQTVHQELSLLPHLSVAENLLLGRMPHDGPTWKINWNRTRRAARAALDGLGFENIDVEARTDSLAVSSQQIVEIAKALVNTPEILILDEPTAVLSTRETDILFGKIRELIKRGTTVIYVSHRIEEIFDISNRVLVLKDGAGVLNCETKSLDYDTLVRAMVGRSLATIYPIRTPRPGRPVLQSRDLCKEKTLWSALAKSLACSGSLEVVALMSPRSCSGRSRLHLARSSCTAYRLTFERLRTLSNWGLRLSQKIASVMVSLSS